MKTRKKLTISLLLVALLFGMLSTLAYMTKGTEKYKNVFTVGDIDATLTEENWKEDENQILPGLYIDKDPTLTVKADSVNAYGYVAVKSYFVLEDDDDNLSDAVLYFYEDEDNSLKEVTANWNLVSYQTGDTDLYKAFGKDTDNKNFAFYIYRVKFDLENNVIKTDANDDQPFVLFNKVTLNQLLTTDDVQALADTDMTILVSGFVHQADITPGAGTTAMGIADAAAIDYFTDPAAWTPTTP